MSTPPRRSLSLTELLDWEKWQERPWAIDGLAPSRLWASAGRGRHPVPAGERGGDALLELYEDIELPPPEEGEA